MSAVSIAFAVLFVTACATGADTVSAEPPRQSHQEPADERAAEDPAATTTYTTHTPSPPDQAAQHDAKCDAGDAAACHAAALDRYYAGSPENDAAALARFRKACHAGYAPSCNGVGTMYNTGRGVTRDYAEAVRWFRMACAADGSTGCQHLAQAYEHGRGVPVDREAARIARERGRCLFEQSLRRDAGVCPPVP